MRWPRWSRRRPAAVLRLRRPAFSGLGLGSRVGRRFLLLFLVAAGLPMALMSLLSSRAVDEVVQRNAAELRAERVRSAATAVLGRLMAARTMMRAWPESAPGEVHPAEPKLQGSGTTLPGLGVIFTRAALLSVDQRVLWASDERAGEWGQLRIGASPPSRQVLLKGRDRTVEVGGARLIELPPESAAAVARVLMVLPGASADGRRWVAELAPEELWQTLAQENEDGSHWCVSSGQRVRLYCGDLRLAVPGLMDDMDRLVRDRWDLFLAAEFGTGDWQFERLSQSGQARLGGLGLEQWFFGVTLAALLLAGLLSISQVRRTLGPLQSLTQATRRLAQRERRVNVEAITDDEFGELALSFNDMARRIDAQLESLQALSDIDRLILQAGALDAVVQQVLSQALAVLPRSVAAVAVLPQPGRAGVEVWTQDALQRLRKPPRAGRVSESGLEKPIEAQQLDLWGVSLVDRPAPWSAPVACDGVTHALCLPVTWNLGTQALLLVGLRPALRAGAAQNLRIDEEARRRLGELRDRLAVAFASHERQQTLLYRAVHDSLTGLANRQGLHDELDLWLREQPEGRLAVLFIDLDRFKQVNDSQGHDIGDELLRQASERLRAAAPQALLVARQGGDEFVVLLPEADVVGAAALAGLICERMALPFDLRGRSHFLGASVGIALAPSHGNSRAELLRHADIAMYAAKQAGRGRYAVFEHSLDAQTQARLQLTADLRRGIQQGELMAWFQPRVNPVTGQIASAEALVRWRHPQRGLVPPGEFISIAEETDLIEAIGNWMLRATCAQLAEWRRQGVALQRVSVNVSPRQLASGRLLEEVQHALSMHAVPPAALELEVTESLLVGDTHQAREQLAQLRAWGVTIALDDFGTGYSSLATLRDLPIDVMKVDRAFVKDLGRDPTALAITRTVMALAQTLGKHTVAEGIETPEQAELLRELGCDELQGFLFSRPVPAQELPALPGWPDRGVAPADAAQRRHTQAMPLSSAARPSSETRARKFSSTAPAMLHSLHQQL
jgi:diguanylate cyclase (GGDEF)-like protein